MLFRSTYLTQGKRIDGTMYSCTSLGVKIGGGIGTAVVGWLLEFSGYIGTNATQPQSALDMMQFMYLWLPLIFDVLIMFVLSRMNVEDANKKLKAEKGIVTDEVTDASDINSVSYTHLDVYKRQDMILFATPVYWWGMSAQLKLIIDKCYCRGLQLKNKKVGTIVVGGSPVDSIQYELIDKQFDCMAKYLSWDMLFQKSYYATARDELEKNKDSMNELEGIGKNL